MGREPSLGEHAGQTGVWGKTQIRELTRPVSMAVALVYVLVKLVGLVLKCIRAMSVLAAKAMESIVL